MRLAALINLGVLMHRDDDLDDERLNRRDAVIGAEIHADKLSDTEALTAWVRHRNGGEINEPVAIGEQAVSLLQTIKFGLAVAGFLFGLSAMASALAFETHTNVIALWTILLGSQIFLLILGVLAILPARLVLHLPALRALQQCMRFISLVPIRMFIRLLRWFTPAAARQLHHVSVELQRSGAIYGDLARWMGMLLTQIFAMAFNLGMLFAFLALSYGNDPTFGWRSTMLTSGQMHQIMEIIAWPWSTIWPDAVPTLEMVTYVKDSSKDNVRHLLDPDQRINDVRMWASLWPFLLASLCFYGVLPRVGTLAISLLQVHRNARPDPQHQLALRTLLSRLRRPRVTLESHRPSNSGLETQKENHVSACNWSETAPVPVFQWSGIRTDSIEIGEQLRRRFGVEIAFCARVGELDPKQDEIALTRLNGQPAPERVVVLVECWESPDADYLDFFERLRHRVAAGTEIAVVLCPPPGTSGEVRPHGRCDNLQNAEKIWRTFLTRCGDCNLSVTTLYEGQTPGSPDR